MPPRWLVTSLFGLIYQEPFVFVKNSVCEVLALLMLMILIPLFLFRTSGVATIIWAVLYLIEIRIFPKSPKCPVMDVQYGFIGYLKNKNILSIHWMQTFFLILCFTREGISCGSTDWIHSFTWTFYDHGMRFWQTFCGHLPFYYI